MTCLFGALAKIDKLQRKKMLDSLGKILQDHHIKAQICNNNLTHTWIPYPKPTYRKDHWLCSVCGVATSNPARSNENLLRRMNAPDADPDKP